MDQYVAPQNQCIGKVLMANVWVHTSWASRSVLVCQTRTVVSSEPESASVPASLKLSAAHSDGQSGGCNSGKVHAEEGQRRVLSPTRSVGSRGGVETAKSSWFAPLTQPRWPSSFVFRQSLLMSPKNSTFAPLRTPASRSRRERSIAGRERSATTLDLSHSSLFCPQCVERRLLVRGSEADQKLTSIEMLPKVNFYASPDGLF